MKKEIHMKRVLVLNSKLIRETLFHRGQNPAWLSRRMGITRQRIGQILKDRPQGQAQNIGHILGMEPKALLLTIKVSERDNEK